MNLLVVIVNYRTGPLVVDCLESLERELRDVNGASVVVVDNASPDDSADVLERAIAQRGWGEWARVVRAQRNGGFAYGNNTGVRAAEPSRTPGADDAVWFLNPDTVVRPGTVNAMVAFLRQHPRAGVVGCRLTDPSGSVVDWSAHTDPSPIGELENAAQSGPVSRMLRRWACNRPPSTFAARCDWVSGASMLVRRSAMGDAGLFDEGFFLYFEEIDLCRRIRQVGWEVWYDPSATVIHLEGRATDINKPRRRLPPYWYESRRRFFIKHYGVAGLIVADAFWAIGRFIRLGRFVLRLPVPTATEPTHMVRDLLAGDLRAVLTGKAAVNSRDQDAAGSRLISVDVSP